MADIQHGSASQTHATHSITSLGALAGIVFTLAVAVVAPSVVVAQQSEEGSAATPAQTEGAEETPGQTETAVAEEANASKPAGLFDDLWTRKCLTGDWGGARTELEKAGLSFSLFYNAYYGYNAKGGLDTGHRASGSYDFIVTADLDKMGLVPGGKILGFAQGWQGNDRNINNMVGALGDPIDDADGTKVIYVDQLWYEQSFFDDLFALRFGRLDQQSIIDRNAFANSEDKQFLNTYLDNQNAIIPLTIGMGATLWVHPTKWLTFILGAADGDARIFRSGFDTTFHDGADFFGYFETDVDVEIPSDRGSLKGTYRFGLLYDPATKQVFRNSLEGLRAPRTETGDVGFYVNLDQMIYRESAENNQGLGMFCRYGYRHGEVNRVRQFWSAGFSYTGLIPKRDEDVTGFGFYLVDGSNHYRHEIDREFYRESGYELYYRIQVTPWLTVTPDLQYISRPGGSQNADDAFVMGVRARVTF